MIDRHRLFAECLGTVLQMRRCELRTVPVPPEPRRTRQVLAETLSWQPEAAIVNADLEPQCSAPELVGALAGGGVAVVVVAEVMDQAHWGHCLAAGARVVVSKQAGLSTLVSVIGRLSRGERVLDLAERERLLQAYRQQSAREREALARLNRLSTNEGEILLHLMAGRTVREIAASRVVSEMTVRTQVKSVLGKLEVSSQLSAVALAHAAAWEAASVPTAS